VYYEYFSRCETFCLQGPSRCVGEVKKDCCDPNNQVPQFDKLWEPTCGSTFTCSRLCKRPVVEERPIMRCVVEDVCSRCGVAHAARASHPLWARKKPASSKADAIVAGPGNDIFYGRTNRLMNQSQPVISDVPLQVSMPVRSPLTDR
jgi:hypothetical protein